MRFSHFAVIVVVLFAGAVLVGVLTPREPQSAGSRGAAGDPAAPLRIAAWVKGAPVDLAEGKGKHIYIVDFWATWCKPCHQIAPLLSMLQEEYADEGLVVVGVSREDEETVRAFLDRSGVQMNYTVAVDDNAATFAAYMNAFGAPGLPWTFVVDRRGIVVWNGHPARGLEEIVKRLAAPAEDGSQRP